MKKTLTLLFAAAVSCAITQAGEILNVPAGTEEIVGSYDFSAITPHVFTLGITLDTTLLSRLATEQAAATSAKDVLFTLSGGISGTGNSGAEGVTFSKGMLGFNSAQKGDEASAIQSVSNADFAQWTTNSSEKTYQTLKDNAIDWGNAKNAAFILVGSELSTTKNKVIAYLFVEGKDDSVYMYSGTKNWGFYTNIDTLTINSSAITSIELYDETLDVKTLAQTMLAATNTDGNVPEPTTATLSLLALAGLAARRRRK